MPQKKESSLQSKCQLLSCVQLFAIPWSVAASLLYPWNSLDKNTAVGCHSLLQGIFPTGPLYTCLRSAGDSHVREF